VGTVLYVYSCLIFTNPRSAHTVCLCFVHLRTDSNYFPILIGFCDGDGVCLLRGTRFVRFAATLRIHRRRNVQCHCHHSQFDTLLFSPNSGVSPNFTRGAVSVAILNCLNLGAGFGGWTRIVCLASACLPDNIFQPCCGFCLPE